MSEVDVSQLGVQVLVDQVGGEARVNQQYVNEIHKSPLTTINVNQQFVTVIHDAPAATAQVNQQFIILIYKNQPFARRRPMYPQVVG